MLTCALIVLLLIGLGASPIQVASALYLGACGSWLALTETLVKATPLVFTGLAVALAFRASLWNIGADGQLLVGALAATAAGIGLEGWPRPVGVFSVLAVGTAAGALWGGVCGWMRVRYRVSEVISTILMNYIAVQAVGWAVHGPLIQSGGYYPQSNPIAHSAELWRFAPPSRLNAGMVVAVVLAIATQLWLFRTRRGFELRAVGAGLRASTFYGLPVKAMTLAALAVSGALAGLGGAVQVSAISHRLYEQFSPGWGFEAIAVALVARLYPIAVVPAALFFGALDNGAQTMQRVQGISPMMVQVVQAMVIFVAVIFDGISPGWTDLLPAPAEDEGKVAHPETA